MPNPYIGLALSALLGAGFLITMLWLSSWLGPRRPSKTKQLPFECGSVSVGNARDQRFDVKYYIVAVMFILFEIEVIYLYPWAVMSGDFGWTGFFAVLCFLGVLAAALFYIWSKGVFDWNR